MRSDEQWDVFGMRFRAHIPFTYIGGVELRAFCKKPDGLYAVTMTPTKTKMDDTAVTPPCLELHMDEAQSLMDAMYDAGVRPSDAQGSSGMLKAVQDHLEDVKADKEWLKGLAKK